MSNDFDVLIIGGGPAGSATALALLQNNLRVALVEKSNYERVRIGETLTPAARVPLEQLGVWSRFLNSDHIESTGTRAAWGEETLTENHFIANPYGNGWHLDRARFDRELVEYAEERGAHVYRAANILAFYEGIESDAPPWAIEWTRAGQAHACTARFLVDATGRASFFARKFGAKRIEADSLIGVVRFFTDVGEADNRTLVESAKDGWWYSALLPDERVIVAYMSDADLIPNGTAREKFWDAHLRETDYTYARVSDGAAMGELFTLSANSYLLDTPIGKNWLAVGDAAMAFDPLSSQGIYNALTSGICASEGIRKMVDGDPSAGEEYADGLYARFDSYLQTRAHYYASETRWRDSEFWRRRRQIKTFA